MRKPKRKAPVAIRDALFDRVVIILEQARGNVVRAVNTQMVTAYWLIGREIVEALQGGEKRAAYGREVIESLSMRLTERYGRGFSEVSLQRFRKFYLVYRERLAIPSPAGTESGPDIIPSPTGTKSAVAEKLHPTGREIDDGNAIPSPPGRELAVSGIRHPAGTESPHGFSTLLSWSHYRALIRVEDAAARDFYEREAAECGWSKAQLKRQIQSYYYERILKSRKPEKMLAGGRNLPILPLQTSHPGRRA